MARLDGPAAAAVGVLIAAGALLSCESDPSLVERPLLDPLQSPEIITEGRTLEPPPSMAANRFVHGWWGWVESQTLRLVPYRRPARIEVATLEPRPRTLRFETKVHQLADSGVVEVTAGGRPVATLPLDPEVLVLPPLPIGRQAVDFLWPEGSEVGIERATFEEALPAGRVDFEDRTIRQSGYSIVDLVRRVSAGSRLRGRLTPPADPRAEQSFEIHFETEDGRMDEMFAWPEAWWRRLSGSSFDLPLGDAPGLVRIRLLARGTGEPAVWSDLKLVTPPPPAPLAPTLPAPPRLVLLYVLDALRADTVGHLGGGETITPALDRLAREGVTFTDHQSLAPNTLPSTKTLFTGRPVLHSDRSPLPPNGPPLLAELFAAAGRRTALFSGNIFVSDDYGFTRGFEHCDRSVLLDEHPKGAYNDNAEWVHAAALDWLAGIGEGESIFLYVHTIHPHNPYDPPAAFEPPGLAAIPSQIGGDSGTLLKVRKGEIRTEPADRERIRALYRGGLAYGDAQLGELLADVGRRYEPGEVLVVVTSDHGEELFDHNGALHGFSLYRHQLHVPLVAWWPGVIEPRSISSPTSTQDLYVTLRQLVDDYDPPPLSGRSLWPLLLGPDSAEPPLVRFAAAPGVDGGIFAASTPTRKLVWAPRRNTQWGMGTGPGRDREPEYVFDLVNDPHETTNLAGTPSLETDWLRGHLRAWVELGQALQPGSDAEALTETVEKNLRALGYLD